MRLFTILLMTLFISACGGSSSSGTDTTDTGENTNSTDQTENTNPSDTTDSTDQTDNTDTSDTTDSTDQTEATDPTDTTDSTDQTKTTDPTDNGESSVDITDIILTKRATNCSEYVKNYTSSVKDIKRALVFDGNLEIQVNNGKCSFDTNAIPNHDFNDDGASFATDVSENYSYFEVTQAPTKSASSTALSIQTDNAIFLNGVKLDLLAAGCFGVGDGRIGCGNMDAPFRYDPMSPTANFGTDSHNAHTQPDGTYHYHGNPNALFYSDAQVISPVIGFAADGFPIYGSYFDDNGTIRKATSSYQLKSGYREGINGIYPEGNYDGTFVDDYQYSVNSGDLDECNGMTINGSYGYYVTDSYPWVLGCFSGMPDSSFNKR